MDLCLYAFAATIVLALVYFTATYEARVGSPGSILLFYLLPTSVLLVVVWALRASLERRAAVALLLTFTTASAYGAEALLRTIPSRVPGFDLSEAAADSACPGRYRRKAGCLAAAESGVPFDTRTTLEVIEDLESEGRVAWPSIDASHYVDSTHLSVAGRAVLPLAPGLSNVLTVFCNESGSWVTYQSDERGFHNPPGLHAKGRARVALVGDSFVHGWCVPTDADLSERLRSSIPGVLNLGLEGSGPLAQLGIVREFAAPLEPELVVWLFFEGNDLRDLERERRHELLVRYLGPEYRQGLVELQEPLEKELRHWIVDLRREAEEHARAAEVRRESRRRRRAWPGGWIRLLEIRSRIASLLRERPERAQVYDPELFGRIAARMRDDVRGWGGELLFVYIPSQRRFEDPSTANPYRDQILSQIRKLSIPVLDLYGPLSQHPDPLSLFPFRVENHFTAEGYAVVARALEERIRELAPGLVRSERGGVSEGPESE